MAKTDKHPPAGIDAEQFVQRKYELDRVHELELNKFTHSLEMEQLKLLLLLNGGAAAAWLSFAKPDKGGVSETMILGIVVPAICWLSGMLLASFAVHKAASVQRGFTQAYHNRRRAEEWRIMSTLYSHEHLEAILPRPLHLVGEQTEAAAYQGKADEARARAEEDKDKAGKQSKLSIAFFALGVAAAALATPMIHA